MWLEPAAYIITANFLHSAIEARTEDFLRKRWHSQGGIPTLMGAHKGELRPGHNQLQRHRLKFLFLHSSSLPLRHV